MIAEGDAALAQVLRYHDRTKHDFRRSARGPGYLDWANQPDPFRRYEGAPLFMLPFGEDEPEAQYEALYTRTIAPWPLTIQSLSLFFECSLGVSATKSAGGSSWKLRCNPSSGNLHPTEGYAVLPAIEGLSETPGAYHYRADVHGLEKRCEFSVAAWAGIVEGFLAGTFLAGLSSIYWREAWKYGERAYRYCNHDAGHALGALRFSAASLGWRCVLLNASGSADVAALLGLDRTPDLLLGEREHPDVLFAVLTRPNADTFGDSISAEAIQAVSQTSWRGLANTLSGDVVEWPIVGETADACCKPITEPREVSLKLGDPPPALTRHTAIPAAKIFRQRRSAVDMDGVTSLPREDFFLMIERTLPREGRVPFDAWPDAPEIHLGIFVHRVDGLIPGLYFLVRNPAHLDHLRLSMRSEFLWAAPTGCPADLPLYHLASGDCRGLAAQISCTQDIAGTGAFSLGMIARFEPALRERGAWFYPRLFWEAGLIGQVLYLEAEAAGLRGTGIGCYFDDPVHHVFGFGGHAFQSLYHFTAGGPVDDPRLSTLPPYNAERCAQSGWV